MRKDKGFFFAMLLALLTSIAFFMVGCSDGGDSPVTSVVDNSHPLALVYQQGLTKQIACSDAVDSADIDIGCLFHSGNFYFVLSNTSALELTDIKIASSNPAFSVSPSNIASIAAPSKQTGVVPILKLAVDHRSPLEYETEGEALPHGSNKTTLTISGNVGGEPFTVSYVVGGYAETIRTVKHGDSLWLVGSMEYGGSYYDSALVGTFNRETGVTPGVNFAWQIGETLGNRVCFINMLSYTKFYAVFANGIELNPTQGILTLEDENCFSE